MKFNDYKYIRPDFDEVKVQYLDLINDFKMSNTAEEQYSIVKKINALTKDISTMAALVRTRNSINTADKFYEDENEYIDNMMPKFQGLTVKFYKALLNSKFKKELKEKVLPQLHNIAEMEIRAFSDDVIPLLQEENKLVSQYSKLISSAKISFNDKILNLSQMEPYMQSTNRNVRKEAFEKWSNFFEENESSIDNIYDKLVKVRNKIALTLGFKNFVELGYLRKRRSDYNACDIQNFREQVLNYIVPISNELRQNQSKRIGVEKLKYYDLLFNFTTGNPTPKGDKDWMLSKAKIMYTELSKETDDFINFMIDRDLFDLDSKPNKQSGGYCVFFHNYQSPFIFANFNGSQDDVNVLTHEAGHAFQTFQSSNLDSPEFLFPTSESDEIFSMSMEFITWPWLHLFFENDIAKYKFLHLSESLLFIPYAVTVDEFQHIIYENPNITPDERKKVWRDLEIKYTPYKDYDDNEFLNKGCLWYKQGHIFFEPFYYIDYALAQICADQYWIKFNENREKSWHDYLNICKIGGSKTFLEILKEGGLNSPFEEDTIKSIIAPIKDYIDKVDDSSF